MILVSACLLGCACRYDGQSKPNPLAQELAAQGIATVRLDFPGCGDSTEPFTAYTLSNMADDVESAILYMQSTYGLSLIHI